MRLLQHTNICLCKRTLVLLENIGVIVKWEHMPVWKHLLPAHSSELAETSLQRVTTPIRSSCGPITSDII